MEKNAIDMTKPLPNTKESLKKEITALGVEADMDIVVHSSLSSLGWVCGGEVAVVEALKEVVSDGTIIMPAHTAGHSEPSYWENPPVPESWWQVIRDEMPAYDNSTPTRQMGKIAEYFRTSGSVIRSNHPQISFSAWGKNKDYITDKHSLDYSIDDNSPLGRLYKLDGYILLLGVEFDRNTAIHLGEYKSGVVKDIIQGSPIIENKKRLWKTFKDTGNSSCDFLDIQREFIKEDRCIVGKIGEADCYLMKIRAIVDFAAEFIKINHKED